MGLAFAFCSLLTRLASLNIVVSIFEGFGIGSLVGGVWACAVCGAGAWASGASRRVSKGAGELESACKGSLLGVWSKYALCGISPPCAESKSPAIPLSFGVVSGALSFGALVWALDSWLGVLGSMGAVDSGVCASVLVSVVGALGGVLERF